MIEKIDANERYFTDIGWLKSYWLFSFGDYFDPYNVEHGSLRVFNDDVVEPHSGFNKHPHDEMEIISIILSGEIVHEDTMGNSVTLHKDDVQRMTAGTGLFHSEENVSDDAVQFFQIWIRPDKKGLHPSYDQKSFSEDDWKNRLKLIAVENGGGDVVNLNTDAKIYRAGLEEGATLTHSIQSERKIFIYVVKGEVSINGKRFGSRDQARISDEKLLDIVGLGDAEIVLVDTPSH